ncbi:MAG TPA: hypothetical protein VGO39_15480 [Gaiellaceae bacterium]|jgi:hypothetical protein|nr:hypothetical protein [Gaiellaceae bacterium]
MAARDYSYDDYDDAVPRGLGWIAFAGFMLVLVGTFNIIEGIVALTRSTFFVDGATYVFSDLHTWGWIVLILGFVEIVAAFAVFAGSELARWFGIGAAGVNALAQLGLADAYPFWSLTAFVLDVLVIYGLAAYGGKKLRTT